MEYLKVKELLNHLSNSDISYLSQKELDSLYKTIEKALKSIEFMKLRSEILSEIEKLHSNLYLILLAKQNKISVGKSTKLSIKNIPTIQKKLAQIHELERSELPKHKAILDKLWNTNQTEFLKIVNELSKNDLELLSYLANVTDANGRLIKLGNKKSSHKNNLLWFEFKSKKYTTGLELLQE